MPKHLALHKVLQHHFELVKVVSFMLSHQNEWNSNRHRPIDLRGEVKVKLFRYGFLLFEFMRTTVSNGNGIRLSLPKVSVMKASMAARKKADSVMHV